MISSKRALFCITSVLYSSALILTAPPASRDIPVTGYFCHAIQNPRFVPFSLRSSLRYNQSESFTNVNKIISKYTPLSYDTTLGLGLTSQGIFAHGVPTQRTLFEVLRKAFSNKKTTGCIQDCSIKKKGLLETRLRIYGTCEEKKRTCPDGRTTTYKSHETRKEPIRHAIASVILINCIRGIFS